MCSDFLPYIVSVAANLIGVFGSYTIESHKGLELVGGALTGRCDARRVGVLLVNC